MPVTDDYEIEWKMLKQKELMSFLVDHHGFSVQRVENAIDGLNKSQTNLGAFL